MTNREKMLIQLEGIGNGLDMAGYQYDAQRVRDALNLLREQEPVKPADHGAWGGKKCGECGTIFDSCVREDATVRGEPGYCYYVHNRVRYCPWCGKEVKWDA